MAGAVNLSRELENLGDVFAGNTRGHDDRCVWNKVKIIFKIVEDFVGVFMVEVSLCDDENNTLSGVNDLAGEALVELGMWLGAIDEHAANVGLFDGGEAAEGGEFFDAYLAFAWLT